MLEQVEQWIRTKRPLLAAVPISAGQQTPTPDVLISLFETTGQPPETAFGQVGVYTETPTLIIRTRGKEHDYRGPRDMCFDLMNAVCGIEAVDIADDLGASSFYEIARPDAMPSVVDRDDQDRVTWSVSFSLRKRP